MAMNTLQPLAYAVAYATFALGLASIFLRFYCRLFILKTWGWDDYLAIGVLVSILPSRLLAHQLTCHTKATSIGQQVILQIFLSNGAGR
jgi:hypothetical protein